MNLFQNILGHSAIPLAAGVQILCCQVDATNCHLSMWNLLRGRKAVWQEDFVVELSVW